MFVKIEPSGCCERKGLVQVRFSFYLEDGDYGYERHHVQVSGFSKDTYKGRDPNYFARVRRKHG
uniref:Uncharacterized protein n=1 Tax=viral metagenome TaxID=1070528 RepID=A0A6M3KFC0_9ZZZZ